MTMILLHKPVASFPIGSNRRLERIHMFPDRHLGEDELSHEQAYVDLRLLSLLRGRRAGIISGLNVNFGRDVTTSDAFTVEAGLAVDGNSRAVALYQPLRMQWQELISQWLNSNYGSDATGVYYLMLKRSSSEFDTPDISPCQRMELDPTRETRYVVTGSLELLRLNIDSVAVTTFPQELLENWVAADRVDGSFLTALGHAIPLALVAIGPIDGKFAPLWLSTSAGRYEAISDSGYRVLLNQTSLAMRRIMQQAAHEVNETTPLADFLDENLHLDFLPAAGQLPLEWLQSPDAIKPQLLWLPKHLGIDMIPVPEEAIPELLNRHIARRAIDLRHPTGDKIRLLLAVNEPDYRHDLLDIPQTDTQLEQDVYRFYMRAYEAWRKWREQFDYLYYVEPSNEPPLDKSDDAAESEKYVLDPTRLKQLDLPKPVEPPLAPTDYYTELDARCCELFKLDNGTTPYPFDKDIPSAPPYFLQWLDNNAPPPIAMPSDDGLLVQYAVATVELEAIENQVRAIRSRVEKTRDLLMLMRQQLDTQTVSLAALAGGVAGDGSGLQVARWLPYGSLQQTDASVTETSATSAPTPTAQPTFRAFSTSTKKSSLELISPAMRANRLLASKAKTFSAFELSINTSRLEQLSRIAKQTVNKPAFDAKEYRFSVLDHISPEINEYSKAYYGMKEVIATLKDMFDATDASSLGKELQRVGRTLDKDNQPTTGNPFQRGSQLEAPSVIDDLAASNADAQAITNKLSDDEKNSLRNLLMSQYRYHALFKAGKILTQWITICETRYNNIERKLQAKLRVQANKIAQMEKLAATIKIARDALDNFDRLRIEQLGDYGVAQRLLEEDWRQVYTTNQERSRILTSALRGLYYVRVRSTPVSASLAEPLTLRHGSSGDIVPGCDWSSDIDLPTDLAPFFQAVCEIPMNDWKRLKPLQPQVPPFHHFDFLQQIREARFKARPQNSSNMGVGATLKSRLNTIELQNKIILQQWSTALLPVLTNSSLQTQAEASRVLSLEDLAMATGPLRKESQDLKEQLEHAACCLLEKLRVLPGSIRLQWGQLAEDDQIHVEDVSWWPGLERSEASDFNAVRTIAELTSWWFRQISSDASASSRSAHRNMIRALLIHASLGDPQEILHGMVHIPPRQARIGERLQVKLNQPPLPGTRLQLLDPQQRVVALLAVEDHTPESTRVNIVDLVQDDIRINTRFSVVSNKRTRNLL